MKVRITFEVSDDALLGIGVIENDKLVPAKHADAVAYLTKVGNEQVGMLERAIANTREEFADAISNALKKGESQ